MVDVDLDTGATMNKKIRNSQLAQYNFIFGETCSFLCNEKFKGEFKDNIAKAYRLWCNLKKVINILNV